jgi:hypothetical protein
MTTSWTENPPEQGELFEGYRPLIIHNRKRSTIPAEMPNGAHHWHGQQKKRPEIPSPRCMPTPRLPLPTRKRILVRRDKAAIFKARVKALIERYKLVETGPGNGIRNRPQRPPRKAVRFE